MVGAQKMRALAKFLKKKLPKGWGFVLLVYPFNSGGVANYISDGQRKDIILYLRETANILEANEDFQTPE